MHCDEAARRLGAGESSPELEIHCSACEECRLMAEDFAGLGRAFARARAEWAPSPGFRVTLPSVPWRKLAVAACLLVLPLAAWAASSLRAPEPGPDVSVLIEPRVSAPPSDRQLLGALFLEESQP
jgi:hypothetical protein